MGVVSQLLVRYHGGYTVVDDAGAQADWGLKQGFLTLGSVTTVDEVQRVALAVMSFQGQPLVATTLGVEPDGAGDEPYADYAVGDTITAPDEGGGSSVQRVVSLTVVEDENGEVTYANELKASFMVQSEQLDRQLKKLINGTLKGGTITGQPTPSGSVLNADNGNSVGALRTYVDGQLVKRAASAHTTPLSGVGTTGGTFDPAVDQELEFFYTETVTAGAAGFTSLFFPDGGFPTGLLGVHVEVSEPDAPGTTPYFVTGVLSSSDNTQYDVLVVDVSGVGYPTGDPMTVTIHARGW